MRMLELFLAAATLVAVSDTGDALAQAPFARLAAGPGCADIGEVRQAPPTAWTPIDPLQDSARDRSPRGESLWLRFSADGSAAASGSRSERWAVAMPSNRAVELLTYEPPAYAADTLDAADRRSWLLSFRHLGRELAPHPDGPIFLCFAGSALGADELEVVPADRFRERDLAATQWRSVAFGVIVAMSLFSALFYVALREFVFIKYLGFLLSFLLYLACETRAAHRLPLFSALDVPGMIRLDGMAIDLASGLAFLFALEFANLHRLAPRLARALRWIALSLFPLMLAHGGAYLLESEALVKGTIRASNLLVGGGGMILLAAVVIAAGRRDRYARFYLVGWTPLVLTAFAASTQQFVWGRTASATIDMMLFAGAFESVVLALGLADRTLTYRRELDRA
ncbi:MAG: 7TM-DISM domain-containing protein, partial [Thermoanaerobaculia bacterium]